MEILSNYDRIILDRAKKYKIAYDEIEELLTYNEIQADVPRYKSLLQEKKRLTEIVKNYIEFCQNDDECKDMIKEYQKEKSIQMQELYLNEIELLQSRQRNNYLIMRKLMLNQNIKSEIFLEIESATDVKMMCQIYLNYAKINDLVASVESYNQDYNILKLKICGNLAYERFCLENGIHIIKHDRDKVQEIRVFCYKDIKTKIDENDIKIELFRSSGAGGQNINKLETAVRVTHLKTNITAICQDERSQRQNKERAISNLIAKVEKFYADSRKNENNEVKNKTKKNIVRVYDLLSGIVKQGEKTLLLNNVIDGNINFFVDEILLKE